MRYKFLQILVIFAFLLGAVSTVCAADADLADAQSNVISLDDSSQDTLKSNLNENPVGGSSDANASVTKTTVDKSAKVGDEVEFLITVTNTGSVDLDDLFVLESKYDSGLVYYGFSAPDDDWIFDQSGGDYKFIHQGLLKVGESSSFSVFFTATKLGILSNTAEVGNSTMIFANSTDTTEVINDTDPSKNETDPSKNDTDDNRTVPSNDTAESSEISNGTDTIPIDGKATGNPLIALLMALAIIPIRRFLK